MGVGGTPDNAFVVKLVIEKYRSLKKPVYAAFIDFRKAYDAVNRPLLWECIRGLGVHGRALNVLQSMYSDVHLGDRPEGVLGGYRILLCWRDARLTAVPSVLGLFIDRVKAFMHQMLPGVGVHFGQMLLHTMLYDDDLMLLAESGADLQGMLNFPTTGLPSLHIAFPCVLPVQLLLPPSYPMCPPTVFVMNGRQVFILMARALRLTMQIPSGAAMSLAPTSRQATV